MLNREKLGFVIIIIALLLFITNMGAINNFLSFHTDKTVQMEHSGVVVPDTWNTTAELGMGNKSKSPYSITNGYIILDIFENWPEDHVGPATLSKLSSMEGGNFEVINQEKIKLGNYNVSRLYFTNPSRDTDYVYDHIGVVYIFHKEDCNYMIEGHYFTTHDYDNKSFTKEIDVRVEDMIANMHNKNYNFWISEIKHYTGL